MPPETPLLAGRPTSYSHSPAPLYMPQVIITQSMLRTVAGRGHRLAVTGLRPPFASVAAIIARSRQSRLVEHCSI